MKTRFAVVGIVIVLAVFLVTCELELPGGKSKDEAEYTDWEYKLTPDGTVQLTVWLDGTTPVPKKNNERALGYEIARRSHDYFEAVFISGAGTTASTVARANWEIGQAAGIRGVQRGVDYAAVASDTTLSQPSGGTAGTGAAIIFVGRRVTEGVGTLLGVGHLTHVDGDDTVTTVASASKSVTFTVSALDTNVGYDFSVEPVVTGAAGLAAPRTTFLTATGDVSDFEEVSIANTEAHIAVFKGGATYTLFGLPTDDDDDPTTPLTSSFTVEAKYTIGGLDTATDVLSPATKPAVELYKGICYYNDPANPITAPNDDEIIQVIERLGIYQILGQTYDVVEAPLDMVTKAIYNDAQPVHGDQFVNVIPIQFEIFPKSGGAFAITFQIPVFALSFEPSTNSGPGPSKWYVRPGHGTSQYRLDDGMSSGGAVLLGVGVGAIDWLDIYVNGVGFGN